jgi:hypothetical protein
MTKEVVRADEHRAIGGILSDVSPFSKPAKHERGILDIEMSELQEKCLDEELVMTSKSLQDRKIRNIALMALWRYLIASSKGNSGLVGGKCASLLEFSKLSAVPRRDDGGMFVTVVFLRLKPVGGANANFEAALDGGGEISKNLVVGIAKVEDGLVSNVRFLFTGKLLALNP